MSIRIISEQRFAYKWRLDGFEAWKDAETVNVSYEELIFSVPNKMPINTGIDVGGPFLLHRVIDRNSPGSVGKWYPSGNYAGYVTIGGPSGGFTKKTATGALDASLEARGTTAIARVAPTNPAFSMSTALGELATGGLPLISGMETIKNRTKVARSAGGEYLNVQFGWLPLLSDLRSFAKVVKESHEILENYRKGSGKKIRRRYSFPDDKSETRLYRGGFFPDPAGHFNSFGYDGSLSEHYSSRSWFSGAFRYHIPVPVTALDKFQQWRSYADHLLGVNVTPETVWNMAPWSWAVDWFTNTGDIMTNISAMGKDGLVLQYGYIMQHNRVAHHSTCYFKKSNQGETTSSSRYQMEEWKMRIPATPYGFGINLDSLSAKQVAIVAALGLSKT